MKDFIFRYFHPGFAFPKRLFAWVSFKENARNITFRDVVSLNAMIFLGFTITLTVMIVTVRYASSAIHASSTLHNTLNYQVFEQTKSISRVLQKTADMERKARLFILFSDPALRQPYERQSYENVRSAFKQSLNDLLRLEIDNKIALLINELSEKENLIYLQISELDTEHPASLPIDEAFQGLHDSVAKLSREFENQVDQKFNVLSRESESEQQALLVNGTVLLSSAFIFLLSILVTVSQSIRQLGKNIRTICAGELDKSVAVGGLTDMHTLGKQLDVLRKHLSDFSDSKQQLVRQAVRVIQSALQEMPAAANHLAGITEDSEKSARSETLVINFDKLQNLAEQLMEYIQLSSDSEQTPLQLINIKHLLECVLEDFQVAISDKSIHMDTELNALEIYGNFLQWHSICELIIAETVKFAPQNGEISIILRQTDNRMILEVESERSAMSLAEAKHKYAEALTEPDAQHNELAPIEGLGVALVREYVIKHYGKVAILPSRHFPHGTCLSIQIPMVQDI